MLSSLRGMLGDHFLFFVRETNEYVLEGLEVRQRGFSRGPLPGACYPHSIVNAGERGPDLYERFATDGGLLVFLWNRPCIGGGFFG